MHGNRGEKERVWSGSVTLRYPAEIDEKRTVSELAVEPGKKEGIR
jgi:hypothetical protein